MHFFNIPYVPTISEQFKPVARNLRIKLSYTGMNKLRKFVHAHKDTLLKEQRNNVVYKISCKDCKNASYVGQTSRLLKTRVAEPKSHQKENYTTFRHHGPQVE